MDLKHNFIVEQHNVGAHRGLVNIYSFTFSSLKKNWALENRMELNILSHWLMASDLQYNLPVHPVFNRRLKTNNYCSTC